MAASYFEQIHSPLVNGLENKIQHNHNNYDSFQNGNSAVAARVKSVSNIAKRSAGKLFYLRIINDNIFILIFKNQKKN
jgi:hypothetical protein